MDLNIKENVIFHTILKYTGWISRVPHVLDITLETSRKLYITYVAILRLIYLISNPKHWCVKLLAIHHSMCKTFWRPFWSTYIFANIKVLRPTSFVHKYHCSQRHFEMRHTQMIKWHFVHVRYYVKRVIFNKWSKLDTQLYATRSY